ncbi:hypothetical protein KI809_00160 [Geobacter pelophilus]|uniref:Uncharacterized protein n=1 Tax=Geoanaerobacter pelophilus TaxID=60036 RepID=A0AAW4KXU5_9BACT|nr:hypothetical protein [Geoanaerobacter pelophilus]MBT0662702.1 hypothetical protein [Geoanaerobacter pelophilus]
MLIMVRYMDGSYDMVVDHRLEGLIKAGRVLEFRRGNGWARVGRDQLRENSNKDFRGDERRMGEATNQFMM